MTNPTLITGIAPDASSLQLELELFPSDTSPASPRKWRLSSQLARSSISPGWWWQVSTLFRGSAKDLRVVECAEVDGELILHVADDGDPQLVEQILQRIREAVSKTCGCCGDRPATPYRSTLEGPTVRVCAQCRERLRAGESYLAVADDFYCLDGTARFTSHHPRPPIVVRPQKKAPSFEPLPADELRRVIREMHEIMSSTVVGQHEACARLSLIAGCHVGGGLSHGARALLMGPSGVGKSTLVNGLRAVLDPYKLPVIAVDCIDLSSPAFSGAPSAGDCIEKAIGDEPLDGEWASRAVVILEEISHITVQPDVTGNSAAHQNDVLASLLSLCGHGSTMRFENGTEWSSQRALVIGVGAFTGKLDLTRGSVPTVQEIVSKGHLPLELATRLAEEIIVLRPLHERDLIQLLTHWPALTSLAALCVRLGYSVHIHKEAISRAARVVRLGHDASTPRTAGGWLVSALREALIAALADDRIRELVVAPDSLPIAPNATRPQPPDDPPEASGGWDTTIIMTPR